MTTDYFALVRELSDAAQTFARGLRQDVSIHPDLEQGARHLDAIVDSLDDIDEDETPEDPSGPGVLAESAAVAHQVVYAVIDRAQGDGWGDAMTTLENVVDRVRAAGYTAPDPTSLEWFGDAVPADGSNRDD